MKLSPVENDFSKINVKPHLTEVKNSHRVLF